VRLLKLSRMMWQQSLKGKEHLQDLVVDRSIILK